MTSLMDEGTSLTFRASAAGHRHKKKYNTIVDGIRGIVDREGGITVQAGIVETEMTG
jgi:hypothetical protein